MKKNLVRDAMSKLETIVLLGETLTPEAREFRLRKILETLGEAIADKRVVYCHLCEIETTYDLTTGKTGIIGGGYRQCKDHAGCFKTRTENNAARGAAFNESKFTS